MSTSLTVLEFWSFFTFFFKTWVGFFVVYCECFASKLLFSSFVCPLTLQLFASNIYISVSPLAPSLIYSVLYSAAKFIFMILLFKISFLWLNFFLLPIGKVYSVILVYVTVPLQILYCLDCCNFIVNKS